MSFRRSSLCAAVPRLLCRLIDSFIKRIYIYIYIYAGIPGIYTYIVYPMCSGFQTKITICVGMTDRLLFLFGDDTACKDS